MTKEKDKETSIKDFESAIAELEKIVKDPPPMHSAIGKIVVGSDGNPVINASAVIQAIKELSR